MWYESDISHPQNVVVPLWQRAYCSLKVKAAHNRCNHSVLLEGSLQCIVVVVGCSTLQLGSRFWVASS